MRLGLPSCGGAVTLGTNADKRSGKEPRLMPLGVSRLPEAGLTSASVWVPYPVWLCELAVGTMLTTVAALGA